ncbi:hypothetical protein ACQCS3_21550, partial [Ralstonia pseudosolanacearum]|uniref:hypothetical protein n=1 Tax=Ralstonia pseudosolanacearum TaxID=1310165 RepID=UPI003CF824F1
MAQYAPVGIGCNGLSLGMSLGGVGTIGGGDAAGGAAAGAAGVAMILYPLSAFRAMNKAAENVYA